jgi:hypothetical protein
MRILTLAILAAGMVAAIGPARAQTFDPSYPVCIRVYGPVAYIQCRYTSLAQCAASASGRSAHCEVNPFFARAEAPMGRSGRHRGVD